VDSREPVKLVGIIIIFIVGCGGGVKGGGGGLKVVGVAFFLVGVAIHDVLAELELLLEAGLGGIEVEIVVDSVQAGLQSDVTKRGGGVIDCLINGAKASFGKRFDDFIVGEVCTRPKGW
jgi:hypothetical protein